MSSDHKVSYQSVDFLIPAQKFNIQFSYVTQKGLPFIREFLLRLVHLAPMTKIQIANYFGLSRLEVEEAVSDLIQRGELTLSDSERLTLTALSQAYFTDLGESPQLTAVVDSGATLCFDLVSFTCLGNQNVNGSWRTGISLQVENSWVSQSETLVEKYFQHQFNEILEAGFLAKSISQESKEKPYVYTVNAVNKMRDFPLRLTTEFKVGIDGLAVEMDDFEQLNSSEAVHALIATQLSELQRPSNTLSVIQSMMEIGDEDTLKVFDMKTNSVNPRFIEDMQRLEEHNGSERFTFIGQIYAKNNWDRLQKSLAKILNKLNKSKSDDKIPRFSWIAPSDPFWAKCDSVRVALSDYLSRASSKKKQLYKPTLYVPVFGPDDSRSLKNWKHEFRNYEECINGLVEGMLGGNIEILYLEREIVVVIYHFSQPELLPVTMPLGFISTDRHTVDRVGCIARRYIDGVSSFDKPNDCGAIISKSRVN